ncbi:MAG: xanthan lyase [Prevotellaceae bacterium]|jgi:hypothetical protein|nr:xanthan lyase [Prevotellaceae bacterium]
MKLHHIQSVAKYESILLRRSWNYRVFTILILLFIGILQAVTLLAGQNGWAIPAIPSNIPYVALYMFNLGQAAVAIFLSSDFLKRDKKLDTSEVFYVHELSNAEYVFGKIWGNVRVFLLLNLIVLAMVLFFNIMSPYAKVDLGAYVVYFFLISVPTLVFILGFSVLLMLILRNQALTFVILLGYVGLVLFYIGDKFYNVFDSLAYSLPLMRSDMVGFTNLPLILTHRGIYFLGGLSFICFTIPLFGRLPNTRRNFYIWVFWGSLFLLGAVYCAYRHVTTILHNNSERAVFLEINNKYVDEATMVVDAYELEVEQQPESVSAAVRLVGTALRSSRSYIFSLNPGLIVDAVEDGQGRSLQFTREKQIIKVDMGRNVTQGDSLTLAIRYHGRVDGNFCYLDIPDEERLKERKTNVMSIDKQYVFQTPQYILFTPETYWYPRPGISYSDRTFDWQQAYFSNYRLRVKTLPGLIALSQGQELQTADGEQTFTADYPAQAVTLVIGNYAKATAESDSVQFRLYTLPSHRLDIAELDSITDTIPGAIRLLKEQIERQTKLEYPFKRFSVIEVPAQFISYQRSWTAAQETMQPEMVLFCERGFSFNEMMIENTIRRQKNWAARRGGQQIDDKEAALRAINEILQIFLNEDSDFNITQTNRNQLELTTTPNPYYFFPQLYNFRYNIFSSAWPVANRVIEVYLRNKQDDQGWERNINGISNNEKANILLGDHSFRDLLANIEYQDLMDNIIAMESSELFAPAEINMGQTAVQDSLLALLNRNTFKNIRFEDILASMEQMASCRLIDILSTWEKPRELPFYIIKTPEVINVNDRGKETFVMKLTLTNASQVDGIVNIRYEIGNMMFGGPGMRFGSAAINVDPEQMRKLELKAGQTKQLITLWDEAPRAVTVNTMISKNLPASIQLPIRNIIEESRRVTEKEETLLLADGTGSSVEIIVDNEDSLFSLTEPRIVGLLPEWLNANTDTTFRYRGVQGGRRPVHWTPTTNSGYYGRFIRSAYVVKSGDGSQQAVWKVPIPSPGFYEVSYWPYMEGGGGFGFRNNRQNGEYHFQIIHGEETEDAYLNMQRPTNEWENLGLYYFDTDTVRVVLGNDTELRTVTADAVRLVRRQ